MQILLILSIVSLSAIIFVFYRKISEINCQIKEGTHCGDAPNIFEQYAKIVKGKIREVSEEIMSYVRPHLHSFASAVAKRFYKISSAVAQESLRLYNFIQGKKTLKNTGATSLFIRDMAKHKQG